MGFHRKIINEETTKSYLNSNELHILYSAESIIFMDDVSSEIYELYKQGKDNQEIKKIIYENNQGTQRH
jgi:hypothetical protein